MITNYLNNEAKLLSLLTNEVDRSVISYLLQAPPTSNLFFYTENTFKKKLEPRVYVGDIAKNTILYPEHPDQPGRERPHSIKRRYLPDRPSTDKPSVLECLKAVLVNQGGNVLNARRKQDVSIMI